MVCCDAKNPEKGLESGPTFFWKQFHSHFDIIHFRVNCVCTVSIRWNWLEKLNTRTDLQATVISELLIVKYKNSISISQWSHVRQMVRDHVLFFVSLYINNHTMTYLSIHYTEQSFWKRSWLKLQTRDWPYPLSRRTSGLPGKVGQGTNAVFTQDTFTMNFYHSKLATLVNL